MGLGFERVGQRIADPPEAPTGHGLVSIQNRVELGMGKVGVGNDAVNRCGVRMPGSKIVRRSSDELRLADWLEMLWSIGAIAGPTLYEDGLDDVVTR